MDLWHKNRAFLLILLTLWLPVLLAPQCILLPMGKKHHDEGSHEAVRAESYMDLVVGIIRLHASALVLAASFNGRKIFASFQTLVPRLHESMGVCQPIPGEDIKTGGKLNHVVDVYMRENNF